MKELLIEEKARAYDKAIEKAQKELQSCGSKDCDAARQIYRFFPELSESEDERIRKEIISHLQHEYVVKKYVSDVEYDRWIAWLENQGESDEIKAKEFLINKGYPIDTNGTFPTYEEMYNIISEGLEKQVEQKLKWSENDEHHWMMCLECVEECAFQDREDFSKTIDWLKDVKQRLEEQ